MERERLAQNLFTIMPSIMKSIFKEIHCSELSKHQIYLLRIIKENSMPMSYYSEKMMMPSSNLTLLADKLIAGGLIERLPDSNDRRVVVLSITSKGLEQLDEYFATFKAELVKKSKVLSDADVKRLNDIIEEMNLLFDKLANKSIK